ncbi:MAG TPA: ABC transporter ATP-binding protein [Usitatibacter sp.]|nr:ABC transporter ATP-binding protein [Usitatibacter sp.]
MSSIELQGIAKFWGESRALDGIGFSAAPGSFVVLLGPSGCGKSTTLRLIAGLDTPTAGTIRIGGRDVTHLPPAQRGLAMVFQSYALFPHLTVAENIVFGLRVRKIPDRQAKLMRVAQLLGLEPLLARKPSQLSGGQQQRVALGRAIIAEAPVCLMDEPLSNLDAQLRGEMRREIRALQRRLNITMVYVTHDQTEAMTMADQVVLLRDGRIEQAGTPEELYSRPATAFTASFIGAPPMNLMRLDDGGHLTGVRPEDMKILRRGTGDEGREAHVQSVEYLGADSLISAKLGGDCVLIRVPGHANVRAGETVRVAWDDDKRHLFDSTTGGRKS